MAKSTRQLRDQLIARATRVVNASSEDRDRLQREFGRDLAEYIVGMSDIGFEGFDSFRRRRAVFELLADIEIAIPLIQDARIQELEYIDRQIGAGNLDGRRPPPEHR